ncbi:MAG: histidine phosphatase family protein [Lachnospiraceae bacterium]|nr:histidine phosphatase family protein [Lachnospiraceae bacterium]
MELYIVRHGETLWNKARRLQGNTDIQLNESGRSVAIKTGEALKETYFDVIYSSPLSRAYETACLIRGQRNIEIIKDDRLKELSFGNLEGQNIDDMLADENSCFKHFFDKPHLYMPDENGEALEELCKRTADFMEDVIMPRADKLNRVMIVGHGAMNKSIMCYIKKHGIDRFWSGGLQKNCNVIIVCYKDGQFKVIEEEKIFY